MLLPKRKNWSSMYREKRLKLYDYLSNKESEFRFLDFIFLEVPFSFIKALSWVTKFLSQNIRQLDILGLLGMKVLPGNTGGITYAMCGLCSASLHSSKSSLSSWNSILIPDKHRTPKPFKDVEKAFFLPYAVLSQKAEGLRGLAVAKVPHTPSSPYPNCPVPDLIIESCRKLNLSISVCAANDYPGKVTWSDGDWGLFHLISYSL